MTMLSRLRLRLVMSIARMLRVPIDIQPIFMAFGKNEVSTSGRSTGPK